MKYSNYAMALGLLAATVSLAACTAEKPAEPSKTPEVAADAPKETPAPDVKVLTGNDAIIVDDAAKTAKKAPETKSGANAEAKPDIKKDTPKETAVKDAPKKDAAPESAKTPTMTPSGLGIIELAPGSGPEAKPGDSVQVHYTGWLYENGKRGNQFDSSRRAGGSPFAVTIGVSGVIKGWHEGLTGMKNGGKRELIIPATLGYGAGGYPGVIPPNATLDFEVEIMKLDAAK